MIEASGPLLRGECSKCGLCCTLQQDGTTFVCDYLVRIKKLGESEATLCLMYHSRSHRMPITMTNAQGDSIRWHCAANGTNEETRAIIQRGIGQGCSLEVVA